LTAPSDYLCNRHRRNGTCTNDLRMPVADLNEAVLRAIEEHTLTPEAVEQVVLLTERDDVRERQQQLGYELADVERQIARLTEAVAKAASTLPVESLIAKLQDLEGRRTLLGAEIAAMQPLPRLAPQVVDSRLQEWRRLLRGSTTQGRAVLQRVLRGRIVFRPIADDPMCVGYEFDAPTRFDKLFLGVAFRLRPGATDGALPEWMPVGSEAGMEGIRAHEAQQEADYGLLLERVTANGKWLASPPGFEPGFQP